jgi:RNA polymerase sigma factor (sigma-70 family)
MHAQRATSATSSALVTEALGLYESALIGFTANILDGDWDRARDVVQDCFVKLYLADPERVRDNLKAWLFTVCRNRALDVLRKDRRLDVDTTHERIINSVDARPDPSQASDTQQLYDRAWELLDQLSHNQREVIRLKFQHDCSYKDISSITGLTVGNVGFLMHVGLKKLRALLTQDPDSSALNTQPL